MKPVKTILCALSLLVVPLTVSWADSPEYINYQGLLNGADGQPLPTGNYPMEFNIYDQANLGVKQWGPFLFDGVGGDGHGPVVPVVNGRFNVIIGPLDTGGGSIISAFDTDTRFVEISVNGSPILPRQQFLSTPYAFQATSADVIPNVTPNGSGIEINGNSLVSGRVGIGTLTPGFPLSFQDSLGDKISLFGQSGNSYGFGIQSRQLQIHSDSSFSDIAFGYGSSAAMTETMRIKGDGNVGIGTATPTQAKLVVRGGVSGAAAGDAGYFLDLVSFTGTAVNKIDKNSIDVGIYPFTGSLPGRVPHPSTSIYADFAIWSGTALVTSSDERIKNVRGRSDGTKDLYTLLGIEVTDYQYKDVIGKGNAPQKKVVAQQVEKVYPLAVSRQTDSVPDIYQAAATKDGWVELATDLKTGDRVKLIAEKEEGIHEVLEVAAGKFRTDFESDDDQVFVYGREVNDFRTVDYDAISMLNVSATQELARRSEAQEAELARLRTENADLAGKLATMEARDQLLEARLTRLEKSSTSDVQLTGLKAQAKSAK